MLPVLQTASDLPHRNRRMAFAASALVTLGIALVTAEALVYSPDWAGLLTLVATVVFFLSVTCRVTNRAVRFILVLALSIRVITALFGYYVIELPDSSDDAIRFQQTAFRLAELPWGELLLNPITGAYAYSWLLSIILKVTGGGLLTMISTNVLFGSLIVYYVAQIARELAGIKAALSAAAFIALWPTLILYSAITMREAIIVLLLVAGVYYIVTGFQRRSVTFVTLGWLLCFLTVILHTAMLVPFGIISAAVLIARAGVRIPPSPTQNGRWFSFSTRAVILGLTLIAMVIVFSTGAGLEKIATYASSSDGLFDALGNQQVYGARSRAAYLVGMSAHTPTEALAHLPVRLIYFILSPFPWNVTSAGDLVAMLDALMFGAFMCLLILQFTKRQFSAPTALMAIVAIATISVLASATSNYGTALRHRSKMIPIVVAIVCVNRHGIHTVQYSTKDQIGIRFHK